MNVSKDHKREVNRSTGEFFTSDSLAKYVGSKILSFVKPGLLLEPYAGEGDLLRPFIEENIPCIVNDINSENSVNLENKFESKLLTCYNYDFVRMDQSKIISKWIKDYIGKSILI